MAWTRIRIRMKWIPNMVKNMFLFGFLFIINLSIYFACLSVCLCPIRKHKEMKYEKEAPLWTPQTASRRRKMAEPIVSKFCSL